MLLCWLIPGYGFWRFGHRRRAIYFFVTLQLTFLIGIMLRGSVFIPSFRFGSEEWNVISILTFLTQIFNGGMALLSLLPELVNGVSLFPNDEAHVWADLGSFYLLVSGGMAYYVLVSTYDRFVKSRSRSAVR